jgi:aldose 1-epimerase
MDPKTSINPVTWQSYGIITEEEINQYSLVNTNGMIVKIINYGGIITNILVPGRNNEQADVVLGFDSLDGYLQTSNPYFGCLVGRYANRIANAQFILDDKTYHLAANNNGNSLHGGEKGFNKVIWKAVPGNNNSLKLFYSSKDGEEGYPGNLDTEVTYSLSEINELKITFRATTDKATPVNLSNHSYFNLSAGKDETILDHDLLLNADSYTQINKKLIPTGKLPAVKNTPMDFTKSKRIGKDISKVPGGYDHNWVLNKKENMWEPSAILYHAASGYSLEVFTTQPGIQFYAGNFLDGTLTGKNRTKYIKHAGMCLETQHFPDSPHHSSFPETVLRPGEIFNETTIYKFGYSVTDDRKS